LYLLLSIDGALRRRAQGRQKVGTESLVEWHDGETVADIKTKGEE
jgi:hypothetical protein